MRAFEFLLEYNRPKTEQMFGRQIVNAFMTGPDKQLYTFYDTTYQLPDGTPNMPVILKDVFNNLEDADPTKNKQYVPWLAREYVKQNIKRMEDSHQYKPLLADYEKYKKRNDFRVDAKDIMRLTSTQFYTIMKNYEPPPEQLKDKGKATEVYVDSTVRIIVPEDVTAACYYGQGTQWCTAATKSRNYFDNYNRSGPMYILLPTKPQHEGEKYQLHFSSDQYMDENDDPQSLLYLLQERFPYTEQFFLSVEPSLKELVQFTDDKLLIMIGEQIQSIAMDRVWEIIQEWESDDNLYREWQIDYAMEKGIINDEMDEDEMWDAIHEVDKINDYLSYNDDARRFHTDMESAINIGPDEMKSIADDINTADPDNLLKYTNLELVYAKNVEDYFGGGSRRRHDESYGMVDYIANLQVQSNGNVKFSGRYR
jgi:hypothetical protein